MIFFIFLKKERLKNNICIINMVLNHIFISYFYFIIYREILIFNFRSIKLGKLTLFLEILTISDNHIKLIYQNIIMKHLDNKLIVTIKHDL